jgi:hypothetical protein
MGYTRKFKADEVIARAEDFIISDKRTDPHWTEETRKLINLAIVHLGKDCGVTIAELATFFSSNSDDEILQALKYGYGEKNKHNLSVLSIAKSRLVAMTQ